ncbi:MAG: hypothetical protein SFZ03_07340 [Candidatus Melainabacteria bacterium]|nr:hypothetical protein [Candidatus Melainabacteria bacterium]
MLPIGFQPRLSPLSSVRFTESNHSAKTYMVSLEETSDDTTLQHQWQAIQERAQQQELSSPSLSALAEANILESVGVVLVQASATLLDFLRQQPEVLNVEESRSDIGIPNTPPTKTNPRPQLPPNWLA